MQARMPNLTFPIFRLKTLAAPLRLAALSLVRRGLGFAALGSACSPLGFILPNLCGFLCNSARLRS
jgi:hypothetical protein